MKVAVLVLALTVAAMAQHRPPEETQPPPISITVEELVWLEVGNIIRADTRISQSECKARCDAHFSLSDDLDESLTDIICQRECELAVAGHEDFHRPPGERGGRD
ncbi:hypothetical protein C0Q70_03840 [Pomacea canaliculata]|uniref:WSC domain-containing protein n=1 Tax=Pomacea canaliculata TaxID=400727 RepID=A0A2T7PTY6_POMCA|nr:uncharacterized protein LOC112557266 [Pomacea canaliculata]PVD36850.1 hypothetical protein C0Q70_03840 [Pomacea canaliculata]